MRTDLEQKYELLCRMLVEARTEAGLKQADVAERLGRPQSYISKIERGERGVDVIEFLEIAKAIGFNPTALLRKLGQ
jgi:transcriptional regulator with XRE-family HTH domain